MKIKLFIAFLLSVFTINSFAGVNEDLVTACKKGDLEAVNAAIAGGADANFIDGEGFSTLSYAVFWPEIVQLLIDKGADVSKGKMPPFVQATNFMSVEVMKLLIAKGADPKMEANYETTVDMGAIYKKAIADEKAKGSAANAAVIKVFEGLVNTPPVKTPVKMSALANAIKMGNKACIEVLSAANVKLNAADEIAAGTAGKTMQDFVFTGKSPELFVSFLPSTAKTMEDKGFKIPDWYKNMDVSKFLSLPEQLDYLLKAGFDVNKKYAASPDPKTAAFGRTALSLALDKYMPVPEAMALLIIKVGGNINEVDEKLGTILNLAIRKGYFNVVKAVVEGGADVNLESKEYDENARQYVKGFTPLTLAAMTDKLDIVTYLLQNGSKPSEGVFGFSFNFKTSCATTVKNKTAIFFAIENGNMEMVKSLVENSAFNWADKKFTLNQMEQSSSYGSYVVTTTTTCYSDGSYTPSKYAKECGQMEIRDYLKSRGL